LCVDVRDVKAASVKANTTCRFQSAERNNQNEISKAQHCWDGGVCPYTQCVSGPKIIIMLNE
jgi:hypothetical protein